MATYFTEEFTSFFKELSKNNNTTWFNENKKVYEKDVKIPFVNFIQDVIKAVAKVDAGFQQEHKDAITRINRDIRFSKDKSPYKLHVSAIISAKGKKIKDYPGMYIELAPDRIMFYGGAYVLEKEALQKIRSYIAKDLKVFDKVISSKSFTSLFGELQGEKNKLLAPEFKGLLEQQPLLANKSFYYVAEISIQELTSPTLMKTIMTYYKAGKPVNDFFIDALKG